MKGKDKTADGRKLCTICHEPRDVLVRCQVDEAGQWHFVCPRSCWKSVSGGVIDGDTEHPHYRYGGMWKNKHEAVSAKKPKGVVKKKGGGELRDGGEDGARIEQGASDGTIAEGLERSTGEE